MGLYPDPEPVPSPTDGFYMEPTRTEKMRSHRRMIDDKRQTTGKTSKELRWLTQNRDEWRTFVGFLCLLTCIIYQNLEIIHILWYNFKHFSAHMPLQKLGMCRHTYTSIYRVDLVLHQARSSTRAGSTGPRHISVIRGRTAVVRPSMLDARNLPSNSGRNNIVKRVYRT